MGNRYNHWFWNSNFVCWISHKSVKFDNWLWSKQYNRNNIEEST